MISKYKERDDDRHRAILLIFTLTTLTYLFAIVLFVFNVVRNKLFIYPNIYVFVFIGIVYVVGLILTKLEYTAGIHLFLTNMLLNVLFFDFAYGKTNEITALIYLFPVAICVFILQKTFNLFFSILFIIGLISRSIIIIEKLLYDSIFLTALTFLSVTSMYILKIGWT